MSPQGVVIHKSYIQLKTSEKSREYRKTYKIIWYHPENNWGPVIDSSVWIGFQHSDQKAAVGVGGWGLSQTRPIPRSPDADKDLPNIQKEEGGHPLLSHGYVPGGSYAVKVALSISLACFWLPPTFKRAFFSRPALPNHPGGHFDLCTLKKNRQ